MRGSAGNRVKMGQQLIVHKGAATHAPCLGSVSRILCRPVQSCLPPANQLGIENGKVKEEGKGNVGNIKETRALLSH